MVRNAGLVAWVQPLDAPMITQGLNATMPRKIVFVALLGVAMIAMAACFRGVNLIQAARAESDGMRRKQYQLPDHQQRLLGIYFLIDATPPRSAPYALCADRLSADK